MAHWIKSQEAMANRGNSSEFDPESAIIDAELLIKYRMVNRAIETLERAIDNAPRHIGLREKLREILIDAGRRDQAAQQCLALASLHISAGDFDLANERLLEAKRLDPRVSLTGPFRDLRHAEQPITSQSQKILSGNLSDVNLFDLIQIIENSKLTGVFNIYSSAVKGEIYINEGQIVGAKTGSASGISALGQLLEVTNGTFDFEKTNASYERSIHAINNTSLILDVLRAKDEEGRGGHT
jgi:tetratricopeptide (TPR) repeat protein